ncbi:MAG: glycosyltransferase, partial [Anaerolineae bacterium]
MTAVSSRPAISVVMPTFNRADAIGLTLQHLGRQSLPPDQFEVVVADDGSTDATAGIVAAQSTPFRLVYCRQENRGAAAARNLGCLRARAELLVLLDSDVITAPSLLEQHAQRHAGRPRHLVIGRMKPWPGIERPWYEEALDPEGVGRDYGDWPGTVPFHFAYTCNMSVTRGALEEIGGFDASFPAAGFEDTEFAYRAGQMGYPLSYEPEALGYHNHPRTLRQRCRHQAAHMSSMALLLAKHPQVQAAIDGLDDLMPLWAPPRSAGALLRRGRAAVYALRPVRFALYQSLS